MSSTRAQTLSNSLSNSDAEAMATDTVLHFGRFEIHPAERVLRIDGENAAVGARAFDLLLALAERRGQLVSKQELLDIVWPGLVVEEHNIAAQMSTLRKLLGAEVIATIAGRGYRFVATPNGGPQQAINSAARHNLPEPRTRFIGRETALADLARVVPQSRLTTLIGIGGSGKTRLALQFARDQVDMFDGGVWFVDLAPLNSEQRVANACAASLGLPDRSESGLVGRIAMHLTKRNALLVLDNCEHVRTGAAAIADAVLARAGAGRIVATSREALAITGEQLYPVRAMSLPATSQLSAICDADAVRLFADRARLSVPEFEITADNAPSVADICRRLDGIALAIELAAARVPLLSPSDISARLNDRFRLLTASSVAVTRQQTLAATMQWSYDQLQPAEQQMLRWLAAFAGGCTLDAAATFVRTGDEYEALALLTALHDKSLLMVERGADGVTRPRYQMLETVRQYARERLDECGESDAALARHAQHFLAFAESAAPHMNGPEESLWMARLHVERENLAAAMSWCNDQRSAADPSWGVRLAAATSKYWLFNEIELGCRLALAALERDRSSGDTAARFQTLRGLAGMRMHRGRGEDGLPHARAALALAERAGVVEWQAVALNAIGTCLSTAGIDEGAAVQHFEQVRELAQQCSNTDVLSSALNNIAAIDFRYGRHDSAQRGFRQALHVARGAGNVRSALIFLHNLVRVSVAARRHADAHAYAVEAEQLLCGVGENVLKLELLEVVAGLASSRGEHEVAARFWGFSCHRYTDEGYRRPIEDEAQLARLSASSRQAIGDAAFEAAEAAGRALDLDSAMRELKQWLDAR